MTRGLWPVTRGLWPVTRISWNCTVLFWEVHALEMCSGVQQQLRGVHKPGFKGLAMDSTFVPTSYTQNTHKHVHYHTVRVLCVCWGVPWVRGVLVWRASWNSDQRCPRTLGLRISRKQRCLSKSQGSWRRMRRCGVHGCKFLDLSNPNLCNQTTINTPGSQTISTISISIHYQYVWSR